MPNLKSLQCGHFVDDDDDLTTLAGMFPALEELDMSYCGSYVSDKGVDAALKSLSNLRKIDISFNCQLNDVWLKSLSVNCPLLEEVTCIASRRSAYWLMDSAVCELLGGCAQLKWVRLGDIGINRSNFVPLDRAVCASARNKQRYLEIDYVVMMDKDSRLPVTESNSSSSWSTNGNENSNEIISEEHEHDEEACAARMNEEFFCAWDKLHGGKSY